MMRRYWWLHLFILPLWILCLSSEWAEPSLFGKNKLHTRDLKWHIFETEHFEIFYYPEEEQLAREVCRLAEEAFRHDTRLFRYKPQEKTPLFIYRNQIDFQQTNILPHIIGVGTGGFTEAYKNRVALPAPPSPENLRQVIFHEFIHVLQFNILYGEGLRSFRVYKGYLIPLWIIEGTAEYAAQNWDSQADLTVRDAVLNDRLVPLTLMDGFNHLDDVYLAYKESQLAVQYLVERYGESSLALVFKKFKTQISISQILRETVGIGLQEFNRDFLYWLRGKYWSQVEGKKSAADYGQTVLSAPEGRYTATTGALWSPNGRWLAFLSNQDQTMRIYLKARGAIGKPFPISSKNFEYVSLQGHPLAWSPDSQKITFVAREEGKTYLYFLSITTHALEKMELPADDFFSPAWSPDGKKIALVGVRNGIADIYFWELATSSFEQVTTDRWADETPIWAPDGQSLVYASEREGYWQLIHLSLNPVGGKKISFLTQDKAQHQAPCFSPDGHWLYYVSDRLHGIYNLFRIDLATSAMFQLTDIRTGILQATVAPDNKSLAFTTVEDGNYQVFLMNLETLKDLREMALVATEPEANVAVTGPLVEESAIITGSEKQNLNHAAGLAETITTSAGNTVSAQTEAPLPEAKILSAQPYEFRFSPDLLFLLAGYDSSQGVVGGGYVTASDFLGDHQVSFISDFVPGYQARTILSYINSTYPISISFTGSYQRNYYRIIDLETRAMLDEFNDQEIGGAIGLLKPFSLFDRLETELAIRSLQRERQASVQHRQVSSMRLSLVHDSTAWYDFIPSDGFRSNLSLSWADRILGGEENYTLLQFDAQAYKSLDFFSPFLVLSSRLLLVASVGPEHPLFLFGGIGILSESATLRGYRLGDLIGSQISTLNLELRFPIARNLNYTLWPLDFLLWKNIQAVVFSDIGLVSNNFLESKVQDIRHSIGLGFRLYTFLLGKELLTIRFDIAQRTDAAAETIYTWGIGQSF